MSSFGLFKFIIVGALVLCSLGLSALYADSARIDGALAALHTLRSTLEDPEAMSSPTTYGWGVGTLNGFCQERLELIKSLSSEETNQLLADRSLDSVDRHLVEIARAQKESPDTFTEVDKYYEKAWPILPGGGRYHVPQPPKVELTHLKPKYRLAWEWMLLAPKYCGLAMQEASGGALAAIGDPRSLEIFELAYRGSARGGPPIASGFRIVDALGKFKHESLPQALESAQRMWQFAQTMVGKKAGADIVKPDFPDQVISHIANYFPKDIVKSEAAKAAPGSERAQFLSRIKQIQDEQGKTK